jgi:trimethyllysine dioxygenase
VDPKKTEELARRIAFIRETHYGRFWDFTANMAHGDTAYTNLGIGAHTDSTYFTDPIG